ncbi:MAG: leucyl/phenylalanyl-tRNA--protein transferase [Sulfurimonas sp.]|nr:leucyl/phenylalanyl-tRNA--protein transferase [Sulfurimonas sp.]
MITQLNKYSLKFPHPNEANEDGILAWDGDLTPSRLIRAYQSGIFPWYSKGDPIIWWSPNPRLIMELQDFKLSKSLKKSIKKFEYKFDTAFIEIITACKDVKRQDQEGSWINSEVIEAYDTLQSMGHVHSIGSYYNNQLVGGVYGVVIGRIFCGESMFSIKNDSSKAAYAVLVQHLKKWGYDFIDCQIPTEHLKNLGAKEVSRKYFLDRLKKSNMDIVNNLWKIDNSLINNI